MLQNHSILILKNGETKRQLHCYLYEYILYYCYCKDPKYTFYLADIYNYKNYYWKRRIA